MGMTTNRYHDRTDAAAMASGLLRTHARLFGRKYCLAATGATKRTPILVIQALEQAHDSEMRAGLLFLRGQAP